MKLLVATAAVVIAYPLLAPAQSDSAQAIADEQPRLTALRPIVPAMQVSSDPNVRIDDPGPGIPRPANCTSLTLWPPHPCTRSLDHRLTMRKARRRGILLQEDPQNARWLLLLLVPLARKNSAGVLAVLQYDSRGASPAMACPSIGLPVHLVKDASQWTMKDKFLLETAHHSSLRAIRLLDLQGEGEDQLVIESNFGGPVALENSFQVFDLSQGRFDEALNAESRLEYATADRYSQTLDLSPTHDAMARNTAL